MRSGLRPIHSVETITCTSEMSGTASSGVLFIAQMPQTVRTTVPVNTRNRLDAHQSMIRSIMRDSARPAMTRLLRRQRDFLLTELLAALHHHHGGVPLPGHHDVARSAVHPVA